MAIRSSVKNAHWKFYDIKYESETRDSLKCLNETKALQSAEDDTAQCTIREI